MDRAYCLDLDDGSHWCDNSGYPAMPDPKDNEKCPSVGREYPDDVAYLLPFVTLPKLG